ncbi:MAG: NAD(P)H-dependent oxidoreductase [Deltaproteobacteria bacterium]|jgi:nitroreductase|nr:NAD(P)H-dependent oxidoreductase [Deltaproteobacteria bacterium]
MESKRIIDASIWRSAIKVFDKEHIISNDDFNSLLEIARFSPSSLGLEPWSILVLQNEALRKAIRPYATGAQRQLDSASHFVIFTIKKDLEATSEHFKHINLDVKKLDETAYLAFVSVFKEFQQKKQDLTDSRKRIDWAGKQAYIALGNMMLAAALLGIDSCPIEGFFPNDVETVLEKEGLIDTKVEHIVVMAAFGYRAGDPTSPKTRRSLDEIVRIIR